MNGYYKKRIYRMNKNSEFWTPTEVHQQGSHMIMENVKKPSKIKYVNIDSRFQNEYNSNTLTDFTYSFPQKITGVKSMAVRSAEIPISFYNFSMNRGNTYFDISYNTSSGTVKNVKHVIIPDGNYTTGPFATTTSLINKIQTTHIAAPISLPTTNFFFGITITNHTTITNVLTTGTSTTNYQINWGLDASGGLQKNNFKSSLGWSLGFRLPEYTILPGRTIVSEAAMDVNNIRYLFLVVDEFRSSNPNSFISPLADSLLSKNILARITLNPTAFEKFGSILPANIFNGYLLSDQRVYSGKTDIQKLKIQLVDEFGNPVDLNLVDFSFCLEIEFE